MQKNLCAVLGQIAWWRSALTAEICAGPYNRLLRRQHCSSLCSQSEGHGHVANMASAQRHDLVGFLAVFGRHNIRPPHFASKVSYSASPQTFAECSRDTACSYAATTYLSFSKERFPPLRKQSHLLAAASSITLGREQRYRRPRVALPAAASRQPGMGIGMTSDRDRERKRAAKTHGCVWRHAEFMNIVMSSLFQTLCHQAASCIRFLPSTR